MNKAVKGASVPPSVWKPRAHARQPGLQRLPAHLFAVDLTLVVGAVGVVVHSSEVDVATIALGLEAGIGAAHASVNYNFQHGER